VSDSSNDGPQGPPPGDPLHGPADIGSVGEEAAKLFGALSDWAKGQGSDLGHGAADAAAGAADAFRNVSEHVATGSADCTYCPICRVVHVVRETSPEVRTHLAVAGASLMQAAAALLASAVPDDTTSSAHDEGVEHIDLDDEWPED
jgi:hypothetical protein